MKFSLSSHAWAAPARIACGALALLLAIAAPSIALAEPVAEQAPVSEQPAAPATPAAPNAEPGVAPEAAAGDVSATQQAFQEKLSALGENPSTEQLQQFYQEQGLSAEMIETLMAAQPAADDALLPMHDLSPWGMYQGADIVVKAVMIGLIIASIITWTIWVAKSIELIRARRRLNREIAQFKGSRTLKQAAEQERGRNSLGQLLVDDAQDELNLSIKSTDKDAIKERVSFRLERLVAASGRQMSQGTGMLATIGSTAPFVGLFGTVWGIMNSFIGIAKSQTTNLAVVAPGIAEALLATALGLVAAIPAVVIYNVFARSITGYKAQVADASAQILLLVSRDMDHQPPADRQNAPHVVKVG